MSLILDPEKTQIAACRREFVSLLKSQINSIINSDEFTQSLFVS